MTAAAIILMVLFILVIWGGLVAAITMLSGTDDNTAGELGNAPGTDDASLMSAGTSATH